MNIPLIKYLDCRLHRATQKCNKKCSSYDIFLPNRNVTQNTFFMSWSVMGSLCLQKFTKVFKQLLNGVDRCMCSSDLIVYS